MIKSTLAAVAAAPLFAGAAVAGPYVNVETNAGWTGSDYTWCYHRDPRWLGR